MPSPHLEVAHAKLTRHLHIVGRRDDGLHLIESEMVSLDFADELMISPGDGLEVVDEIPWQGSGAPVEFVVPPDDTNLVVRALRLLGRTAAVRLQKCIPPGAGLGGGSSDAAAIFRWAGVADHALAASLGADIPFCLGGGRARVSGIGEQLEALAFEDRSFLVLVPDLFVSTAAVYAAYDELDLERTPGDFTTTRNDLEQAALVVEPALCWWRDLLGEVTGERPVLAGSGATWFVECEATRGEGFAKSLRDALHSAGRIGCVRVCRTVLPGTA